MTEREAWLYCAKVFDRPKPWEHDPAYYCGSTGVLTVGGAISDLRSSEKITAKIAGEMLTITEREHERALECNLEGMRERARFCREQAEKAK